MSLNHSRITPNDRTSWYIFCHYRTRQDNSPLINRNSWHNKNITKNKNIIFYNDRSTFRLKVRALNIMS